MSPKEEFSTEIGSEKLPVVELQHFLYVRVVEARNLPLNPASGRCDPYVELRIGNYRGATTVLLDNLNPIWNEVFCFREERLQSETLEIYVKDRTTMSEVGTLSIPIGDVPTSLPGGGSLAPQDYSLRKNGNNGCGDLMVALWMGDQTDDEYPTARHSEATTDSGDKIEYMHAKTYQQPRLWYLRVKLIDAHDLVPLHPYRKQLDVYVKARLGDVVLRTKVSSNKSVNPSWNEELVFVAAEPFDDKLVLSLEDDSIDYMTQVLGIYEIPLHKIDKRLVAGDQSDIWVDLKPHTLSKQMRFASKLHLNLYLDGVYQLYDEPSSDLSATSSPKLKRIGKLQLGIVKADGLAPMKIKNRIETTDAYCVARYGYKWTRTRTIVGSLDPKWNEEYQWDVYDDCTVITIGVFDNCNLQVGPGSRDSIIGKVRIQLSTLESGRSYTLAFPLVSFRQDGLKKMGELHLNVRFYCPNVWNLLSTCALLPKTHYTPPLSVYPQNILRNNAVHLICLNFSHSKQPLRKEVAEYMLSVEPRVWSFRRTRANCQRVIDSLSHFSVAWEWYDYIRKWKNWFMTVTVWFLFCTLLIIPSLILPTLFICLASTAIWNYPKRPTHPLFLDMNLSEAGTLEDWQEEFDTFPSSARGETLRQRYDRLRMIGESLVTIVGELANQLERVQCVTNWRHPRATLLFVLYCLFAATITYHIPLKWLLFFLVTYMLRFPKHRVKLPRTLQNFLRRMKID